MIKFIRHIIIIFFLSIYIIPINSAVLTKKSKKLPIKIFYTEEEKIGWNGVIKGKVLSLGRRAISKNELRQLAQDKTKVTVRLYDRKGILKGDRLYIINERNLIVAKISVVTIFKSNSFDYLLIGYGNFRRVQKDFRVVQRKTESEKQYSYIYKSRGDYYHNIGNIAKAINQYEKAIAIDKLNPEAHTAMGYIYLDKKINSYAMKEFEIAYKSLSRIYDNEDKYLLLMGLIKTRYLGAYESELPAGHKIRNRYIAEGITYGLQALKIYSESAQLNYYLGYFYYNNPNPNDVKSREFMLNTIKLDPQNIDAHVVLARLYYKHDNYEKALDFAKTAIKIDPANMKAQDTYKKINKFKK